MWPGASALIVGCGAVGLSALQGARLANAGSIIAADLVASKLALAAELGAARTIDAGAADVETEVMEATGGAGVDFAFDAAGAPQTIDQCVRTLAYGGTAVLVGVPEQYSLDLPLGRGRPGLFGTRGTITVSHGGGSLPAHDYPVLAGLAAAGALDIGSMITGRRPLDEAGAAFEDLAEGGAVRTILGFG
jgi:S-(hydroxymethyl)glutathione dehydrogenase/alcohol dehydrogenase